MSRYHSITVDVDIDIEIDHVTEYIENADTGELDEIQESVDARRSQLNKGGKRAPASAGYYLLPDARAGAGEVLAVKRLNELLERGPEWLLDQLTSR